MSFWTSLKNIFKKEEEQPMKNVLFVVGSLREGSFNHQMAQQAEKVLEGKANVTYLDWKEVPLMNQDLETPVLPAVQAVRDAVKAADAIWIFSPVKNLLDWLSRAEDLSDTTGKSAIDSKVTTVSLLAGGGQEQAAAIYRDLLPFIRTNFVDELTLAKINDSAWADGQYVPTDEVLDSLNKQAAAVLAAVK